jgi:hypothetical protein
MSAPCDPARTPPSRTLATAAVLLIAATLATVSAPAYGAAPPKTCATLTAAAHDACTEPSPSPAAYPEPSAIPSTTACPGEPECAVSALQLSDLEVWRREEGWWVGEYTL